MKAGRTFQEITKNEMKEVVMSTPAISDGVLIVRTLGHVYGLGEKAKASRLRQRRSDRASALARQPQNGTATRYDGSALTRRITTIPVAPTIGWFATFVGFNSVRQVAPSPRR